MIKALIVDDEKPVHVAIKALGEWEKYNIDISNMLIAQNGKEALALMESLQPHLIFLDICMPVLNGLDFLKIAKEKYPYSQFIIVSGFDDFSYAQNALRFGATDYLLKPVEREALNRAILRAVNKLVVLSEADSRAESPDNEPELSYEQIILQIKNYIDNNYSENIRVSKFADKYFFSKEYLTKQFKAKYGFNIYEYVLKVRMEEAVKLLLTDNIKIQDVGILVGFTDNNHFSKAFKNYYEISPSDYRKQNLGQP